MEMGQNQPYKLVDELPANEFYNLEGRQFSKSEGWYIDLEDFFKRYTSDQIRYAIASNAPETSDSEFTWKDFQQRCNSELLGKYGNLVNRVLIFIQNQCQGVAPEAQSLEPIDQEFLQNIQEIARQAAESYDQFKLRRASQLIMELAQLGNVYFDSKRPWQDAKQIETRLRMKTTLACCLECLKALALLSFPVIPHTAEQVWKMLGYKESLDEKGWTHILAEKFPTGRQLSAPTILFQKIEDGQIEEEIQKLKQLSAAHAKKEQKPSSPPTLPPLKPTISIDDVRKLDLRVGIIRQAEPIPKSKKLLRLKVDIGLEERNIVAGIGESYRPEELIGAHVVVVANLQPATLMGVQSEGMLLAAKGSGKLEILHVEECGPGSEVS
jgi:methionyl-tRNA synthetase